MTVGKYSLWHDHSDCLHHFWMCPNPVGKSSLRVTIDTQDIALLRRIAALQDTSVSALVGAAITDFLSREDIQAVIERYNLDTSIDEEGE
jgi:hypothetical protein